MKLTTLFFCCFFSVCVSAQNDLLLLKQKNQTIQTWLPGAYILFQFSSKQWIEGIIKSIKNDSLLIDQIQVRQVANQFGFPTLDTAHFGFLKLAITEIYGLPKRSNKTNLINNGTLFQMGSGAYIFLNMANSLIKNDPVFGSDNLPGLGIASGFFVLGKILQASHKTFIEMGGKYTMTTIKMGNTP